MRHEIRELKEEVYRANLMLYEANLVYGTQGNASGINREKGFVAIKPSGVSYKDLCISDMPVVSLDGKLLEGDLNPSVDLPHHLYLYRHIEKIGGVVHTHSSYATMFAIAEEPIPCFSTGHADIFGEAIPVTPYVDNRGENIGKVIEKFRKEGCPAILLGRHGVFTFSSNAEEAAKAAILVEYVAKSSFGALILTRFLKDKKISPLPSREIEKWYNRYHGGGYGQKKNKS
ncbi:MAG TPA: hypothetical protein EYP78_05830 [Candidatus Omnitrophica bacterium]|nr:hypothetical protein [Candidatus Omnitrophota bacterium]